MEVQYSGSHVAGVPGGTGGRGEDWVGAVHLLAHDNFA